MGECECKIDILGLISAALSGLVAFPPLGKEHMLLSQTVAGDQAYFLR